MPINVGELELVVGASTRGLDKASKALDSITKKLDKAAASAERLQRATAAGMGKAAAAAEKSASRQATANQKIAKSANNTSKAQDKLRQIQLNSARMAGNLYVKQADRQNAMLQKQQRALASTGEQYRNLRLQLVQLGNSQREIGTLDKSFERFQSRLRSGALSQQQFIKEQNRMKTTFGAVRRSVKVNTKVMGNSAGVFRELTSASVLAIGPLSEVGARMQALGSIANRSNLAMAAFIGTIVGGAVALGGMAIGAVRAQSQFERFQAILTSATGSVALAERELREVMQVSEGLGLRFDSLASSYAKIRAAARSSNIETETTKEIFEGFTQAAAAMRLSGEQTTGMFRALEQMISKGSVQAEELRGQLGERLPGAFGLAAKAIGVTTEELDKMLEKGEVLPEELLPAMADQIEKSLGEQAQKNAESLQGSFNNLSNAAFAFFKRLDDVTGISDAVISAVQGLTSALRFLEENMREVINVIRQVVGVFLGVFVGRMVPAVISGVVGMTGAISGLIASLRTLNAAAVATSLVSLVNPLTAVLSVVGGVVGFLVATGTQASEADKALDSYNRTMRALNTSLGDSKELLKANREEFIKMTDASIVLQEEAISKLGSELAKLQKEYEELDSSQQGAARGFAGVDAQLRLLEKDMGPISDEIREVAERLAVLTKRRRELDAVDSAGGSGGSPAESKRNEVFDERILKLKEELAILKESGEFAKQRFFTEEGQLKRLTDQQFRRIVAMEKEIQKREERKELVEDAQDEIADMDRQIALANKQTEAEKLLWETQKGRFADLDPSTKRQLVARARMIDEIKRQEEAQEELNARNREFADTAAKGFEDFAFAIGKGESAVDSLADSLESLARTILNNTVTKQLSNVLFNAISGSSQSGPTAAQAAGAGASGPFDFGAKGLAFSNGVRKMAKGGIIDRPTLFGTSSGAAVGGEAGTEGVLPLTRMPGGDLGVSAAGSGGMPVVIVNVINQGGESLQPQEQRTRRGPNGEVVVDMTVKNSLQRLNGRGELDGILRQHGAKRQGQF